MATILAGDFRKGITFEMDGKVMVIVDFLHVKPGKGAAFVRTKIRDVINGGVIEKTFNPTEKLLNICIQMESCITLWTKRLMSKPHLTKKAVKMHLSLLKRI